MKLYESKEVPFFDCAAGRHNLEYDQRIFLARRFLFFRWLTVRRRYLCVDCKIAVLQRDYLGMV
jgi:hypothetical protein